MTEMTPSSLGLSVRLHTDWETALQRVTAALKAEGFGVLTEIDVKQTLKKKLDVDFRPYKILGACNPKFAHRSLTAAPEVGLLLPCNVTISQEGEDLVEVSIIDPIMMLSVVPNPALRPLAEEVKAALDRVAAALEKQS